MDNGDDEVGNIQAAINAGKQLAKAEDRITEVGDVPIFIPGSGGTPSILTAALDESERRSEAPRRRQGIATLKELDSFVRHVNFFKDESSIVYADPSPTSLGLTAVLNYHERKADGLPRWGDHRSVYACPFSSQWKRWTGMDEKNFNQDDFATLIEDNFDDLASPGDDPEDAGMPQPLAVLEMARKLVVKSKSTYEREHNPVTGEYALVAKLENDEKTSTKIYKAFLLKLPVFESGDVYRVLARVRFQLREQRPLFSFSIYQPEQIIKDAFKQVRDQVAEKTGLPVLAGTPEANRLTPA